MTVEEMIQALSRYPRTACCVAKEGEVAGLEIRAPDSEQMIGYIPTASPIAREVDVSEIVF